MAKSKVKMPKEIHNKCSLAIHAAAVAAGGAAVIPIPVADRIPITAAQVGMVVALGKVFEVTISDTVAKAVIGCGLAQQVGQAMVDGILKAIPVVNIFVAPVVCTITAAGFTEALGWVIADDFYRMSIGEQPENIVNEAGKIKDLFKNGSKESTKKGRKSTSKKQNQDNSSMKSTGKKLNKQK